MVISISQMMTTALGEFDSLSKMRQAVRRGQVSHQGWSGATGHGQCLRCAASLTLWAPPGLSCLPIAASQHSTHPRAKILLNEYLFCGMNAWILAVDIFCLGNANNTFLVLDSVGSSPTKERQPISGGVVFGSPNDSCANRSHSVGTT